MISTKRKECDQSYVWRTKDNYIHREDGPAIEWSNGNKWWCIKGEYHRLYGPAIEQPEYWYLNGIEYKKEKHPFNIFRKEYNLSNNYEEWSVDMKMLFKLIYG